MHAAPMRNHERMSGIMIMQSVDKKVAATSARGASPSSGKHPHTRNISNSLSSSQQLCFFVPLMYNIEKKEVNSFPFGLLPASVF